jgi:flagellar hook capping protein FlgD
MLCHEPRRQAAPAALALLLLLGAAAPTAHADRTAIYQAGTLVFSPNTTVYAPLAAQDGEPSIRVDVRGNCYVGAIQGVPAGVDVWRFDLNPSSPLFDPGMRNPTYLGRPDAFIQPSNPGDTLAVGGSDGGGDIDIAVSFPTHPDSIPVVTIVSLAAATISSAVSLDRGANWQLSPATSIPADDRQWIEATGPNTVYLVYRSPLPATTYECQRSTDHGTTFPQASVASVAGGRPGYVDVDHANGTVYGIYGGLLGGLHVVKSTDQGLTWSDNVVAASGTFSRFFDIVKVARDGSIYACWSDNQNIFLSHSTNAGVTWSDKVRVNDNTVYKTNIFPWLEVGDAGRVAVAWYGTTTPSNTDNSDWDVVFAQSIDAGSNMPTFRQQVVSDHIIHGQGISQAGLTGTSSNRNLIDYFQVAIDPQGAAVIAFTDDHNDFNGHTYLTRQLEGTSVYANANGTGMVNPVILPSLSPPDPSAPEVNDFLHDSHAGLLQPIFADNPYDILWVDYSCADNAIDRMLQFTMKVSDLSTVPPATNWRVNFTANAPDGLSDRGDQFWVRANTDSVANPQFLWGTAARNPDGTVAYTLRGRAETGLFDTANDLVVMRLKIAKLDSVLTSIGRPTVVPGSVLYGLRAGVFTDGANAIRDMTRGGTSYTVVPCGPTATTLARFTAEPGDGGILLRWAFADPEDVVSTAIERSDASSGPWQSLAAEIEQQGPTSAALDRTAQAGHSYWYQLRIVTRDGNTSVHGPIAGAREAAFTGIALGAPMPNPTDGTSSVSFRIGRSEFVELAIFDIRGARVRTLQAGPLAAGEYVRSWDGTTDRFGVSAGPGVYFYVLHTSAGTQSRRVALAR